MQFINHPLSMAERHQFREFLENESMNQLYTSLRDLGPHFIAEGEEVVKALFKSNLQVLSL